jgi:hypothetical protein
MKPIDRLASPACACAATTLDNRGLSTPWQMLRSLLLAAVACCFSSCTKPFDKTEPDLIQEIDAAKTNSRSAYTEFLFSRLKGTNVFLKAVRRDGSSEVWRVSLAFDAAVCELDHLRPGIKLFVLHPSDEVATPWQRDLGNSPGPTAGEIRMDVPLDTTVPTGGAQTVTLVSPRAGEVKLVRQNGFTANGKNWVECIPGARSTLGVYSSCWCYFSTNDVTLKK